ncbi:PREDICTED: ER degradation-enhancing alpha-mannosidase-like protein 2 [Rhagoletis zephyria]|uniref:ER degradation-enhancing alpha-mannosidase-like protein 2 n=1 Tax=Rhagoletis zephyria TaxID=28612 RepID=UPI0008116F6C|nr:PREDICTED: ER degradation-enhancing alpha-mannosidase-like protein 2 [Rhagoletis zephyria]
MFYHAYDSYLIYASGFDELQPISCTGMNTWGTFSLSLIDALDTLAIMGNYTEFRRVAQHIIDNANFEANTNVSVFETNIRVVGGLLSAHLLSVQAGMTVDEGWPCSGPLLQLADNVARKLLPAFDTATGMPYGTVNFLNGVPENETPVTCTAGVGTFLLEFATLSRLTGDPIFEEKAIAAIEGLQKHRSKIGLLGNHINVQDGKWIATEAGIGAGVDSYFEYLVKGSLLLQMPSLMEVFYCKLFDDYELIKNHIKKNDWYVWVSMNTGAATMPIFQSLEAFFPGLLSLVGDMDQAKKSLYNYHQVWKQYGFVPEFYDIVNNKPHKRDGYPLRPEFIESVLYLYQATKDPHLLSIGADVADSILHSARTECGYATIKSVLDHTIEDRMESFFLSETLKYLYLLFDENNFMHNKGRQGTIWKRKDELGNEESCIVGTGGYVFNTEAHPIDIAALSCCSSKKDERDRLKAFEGEINLIDSILPLKKLANCDLDILMKQPLFVDEQKEPSNITDSATLSSVHSTFEDTMASSSVSSITEKHTALSDTLNRPSADHNAQSDTFSTEQLHPSFTSMEVLSLTNSTTVHSSNMTDQVTLDLVSLKPTSVKSTAPSAVQETSIVADGFELPTFDAIYSNNSSAFDLTQYYSELKQLADKLEHQNDDEEEEFGFLAKNSEERNYELLFCPSQPFLARLSLQGQMFELTT